MFGKAMVCCLALWSAGALAQDEMGAYVGGGLGQFEYEEEEDPDFAFLTVEDSTLAYKVYGGYRFNETWAVEGSYTQTDDLEASETEFISGIGNVTFGASADLEVLEVRALAHAKAFFAGIGYWESDTNVTLTLSGPFGTLSASESFSDSGASVVLGGQWDFERVGIRVELEAYDMDDVELAYTFGVGAHYRF